MKQLSLRSYNCSSTLAVANKVCRSAQADKAR